MALEPEYCVPVVIFSAIGSCNRSSKATVKRTTKKRAAWFASYVGHFTTHVQTCLTTNRVSVRSCVNTDFWLDTITRKSRHTRDLRQLLQNKFDKSQWDVQHVQILLQKQIELAWTILYFLQQLCFLATTWFFARQVWSVGGKMRNITMYLVFNCSNVTLQNRLGVLWSNELSWMTWLFPHSQLQFCEQFLYCKEGKRSFLSWTERFLARLDHYTPFEPILSSWKIKQRNVMRC